jgi:hypothetical protein
MSALPLPPRPDLDQLKRQAKELHRARKSGRLRDAQRAIAEQYGFASWDALRAHVQDRTGTPSPERPRRGLDYDDPVPDVVPLSGPITPEVASRLAGDGVSGVRVDASVPPSGLMYLPRVPTLARIDLSGCGDVVDEDLAFLRAMPWLTAISVRGCGRISDHAVVSLRDHQLLEQVNLQWTRTGDAAVAALAGKPRLCRLVVGGLLTDAGASHLRDFPVLAAPREPDSFLSVSSARNLTDGALESIGALKGVAALDLHMSVFGSPHYTVRGVAHLRGMDSLEELNFHGPMADDSVLREIAGIPRLRALHCQDIASGDDGFIALGSCATLEGLGGRVCARVTDRGFAAIARLPKLRSLGLGGPRLTDAGWAPLAEAAALVDLGPILARDGAFAHIAKIERLERLNNMYNRATTDAATRHLRNHPSLAHYSAYGTQITDESLDILADLPRLATLEFENCASITDAGLRRLARRPTLRRVSVWSCLRVIGTWVEAMPPGVEAKSEAPPPGQAEGYRAETLLDYPDVAIPPDAERIAEAPASAGALSRLVPFGVRAAFIAEGLQLTVDPGIDPRWVGALTPDPLAVPVRIDLTVRPITALRLVFGGHNRFIGIDESGALVDAAPWFVKTDAQRGRAHPPAVARTIAPGEWARVTLEVQERQARLFVDGELRHSWDRDFLGIRSRASIGLQQPGTLTLGSLTIETPQPRGVGR